MKAKLSVVPVSYEEMAEKELIAHARASEEGAVRELIARCNQQLFRVARGILGNDTDAEDAVQAAYVAGFMRIDSFRGESGFVTWMTRITMNEAFASLRQKRRVVSLAEYRDGNEHVAEGEPTVMMTPPPSSPEAELGRSEVRDFLERAVDSLPEPFRLAYVLRDVQEMSTGEVADILGINPITVKTRLFRARRLLRAEFARSFSQEFSGIFPFDGARCVGMADRVVSVLRERRPR